MSFLTLKRECYVFELYAAHRCKCDYIAVIVQSHRSFFFLRSEYFRILFVYRHRLVDVFFFLFFVTMLTRTLHQKQLLWLSHCRQRRVFSEQKKMERDQRQIAQSWINIFNVLYLESSFIVDGRARGFSTGCVHACVRWRKRVAMHLNLNHILTVSFRRMPFSLDWI